MEWARVRHQRKFEECLGKKPDFGSPAILPTINEKEKESPSGTSMQVSSYREPQKRHWRRNAKANRTIGSMQQSKEPSKPGKK